MNFDAVEIFRNMPFYNRIPNERQTGSLSNYLDLVELINRLFERHSRLLVVRVDLKYRREFASMIPLETVQHHRDVFFHDYRHVGSVFEHLLGYVWGLEYGEDADSGFHLHCIFFYNGDERREDISIGMAIDELWQHVTFDMGLVHVSNLDKERLARNGCLGIGMIHRSDELLRYNLVSRVAAYVAKGDTVFNDVSGRTESGRFRCFGRSWMPPSLNPNEPRRGRRPTR